LEIATEEKKEEKTMNAGKERFKRERRLSLGENPMRAKKSDQH